MRRFSLSLLKWSVTLLVVAGLLAGAYVVHRQARARLAREAEENLVLGRRQLGGIKLGVELAASYGIQDQPARSANWYEVAAVYGRVVPNPRATAEIRTAFPGVLRTEPKAWPSLGERVSAKKVLGWVDVRLGPQERLDLDTKLREAEARAQGARRELKLHQARVDSLKAVTTRELIARGELDAAQVALAQAETLMQSAQAAVEQLQSAKTALGEPHNDSAWRFPLAVPLSGEITELSGAPGMSVEAGALIARVVDFNRPLVRVDFPPALVAGGPPSTLDLFAEAVGSRHFAGIHSRPDDSKPQGVSARFPRPAPQMDAATQFAGYWYDMETKDLDAGAAAFWRPGLFVKGYVQAAGARSRPASVVPVSALLYHQGRPLVYLRIAPGRYERREVQVLGRQGDDWMLAEGVGVRPGDAVVVHSAQVLLSEEFRGDADND